MPRPDAKPTNGAAPAKSGRAGGRLAADKGTQDEMKRDVGTSAGKTRATKSDERKETRDKRRRNAQMQ